MTEQEYRELEIVLGGLQAVDLLSKDTIKRLEGCLNVIQRDKQLLIHSVVARYSHPKCGTGTLVREYTHPRFGEMMIIKTEKGEYFAPKTEYTKVN